MDSQARLDFSVGPLHKAVNKLPHPTAPILPPLKSFAFPTHGLTLNPIAARTRDSAQCSITTLSNQRSSSEISQTQANVFLSPISPVDEHFAAHDHMKSRLIGSLAYLPSKQSLSKGELRANVAPPCAMPPSHVAQYAAGSAIPQPFGFPGANAGLPRFPMQFQSSHSVPLDQMPPPTCPATLDPNLSAFRSQEIVQGNSTLPRSSDSFLDRSPGGVSESLNYNITEMACFLSQMYESIMLPHTKLGSATMDTNMQSFLVQVLTATRLPQSTLILSLVYLSQRWSLNFLPCAVSDPQITYKMIVVAVLLSNKFNDDNTFTNKSWHDATGIALSELCRIECDWLTTVEWSLHLSDAELEDWDAWNKYWQVFLQAEDRMSRRFLAPRFNMAMPRSPQSPLKAIFSHPSPHLSQRRSEYTIPQWYESVYGSQAAAISHINTPVSLRSERISPGPSDNQFVSFFQQSFTSGVMAPVEGASSNSLPYFASNSTISKSKANCPFGRPIMPLSLPNPLDDPHTCSCNLCQSSNVVAPSGSLMAF